MPQALRFLKLLVFIISIVAISFSISYFALAWSEPPYGGVCTTPPCPPNGNAPAPINVSASGQTKSGALTINNVIQGTSFVDANNISYYVDPSNSTYSALLNGRVGIGTTAPGSLLQVGSDAVNPTIILDSHSNGADLPGQSAGIEFGEVATARGSIWYTGDGYMHIGMNNRAREYMRFQYSANNTWLYGNINFPGSGIWNSSGNVGVGTAAPTGHKLDIASNQGGAGNSAIRALYPGGGGLLGTEFGALANRVGVWTAVYGKQGAASSAAYFDGKVGIGTATPLDKLTVWADSTGADNSSIAIINNYATDAKTRLRFITDAGEFLISRTSNNYSIWPASGGDAVFNLMGPGAGTTDKNIRFIINDVGGVSDQMIIKSNGNVGIGTVSPGDKLEVNGNVKAIAFLYSSDERLKDNIQAIDNSLDKILKLNGVSYTWKDSGVKGIGVTAQNVESVFPELVKTDSATGMKSVEYGNLVAPLIEAIKEQQKMIDKQQKEIEALKSEIEKIVN